MISGGGGGWRICDLRNRENPSCSVPPPSPLSSPARPLRWVGGAYSAAMTLFAMRSGAPPGATLDDMIDKSTMVFAFLVLVRGEGRGGGRARDRQGS